jgi:hypothetical protein
MDISSWDEASTAAVMSRMPYDRRYFVTAIVRFVQMADATNLAAPINAIFILTLLLLPI